MAFQTTILASEAFALLRSAVPQYKAQAQNANAVMAAGSINTDFVFFMLDQLRSMVANITQLGSVTGLNAYATSQGYPNSLTADLTAIVNASNGCIGWIVANFPASGGFLLSHTLNADGSRTPRQFSSAQTA